MAIGRSTDSLQRTAPTLLFPFATSVFFFTLHSALGTDFQENSCISSSSATFIVLTCSSPSSPPALTVFTWWLPLFRSSFLSVFKLFLSHHEPLSCDHSSNYWRTPCLPRAFVPPFRDLFYAVESFPQTHLFFIFCGQSAFGKAKFIVFYW